MEDFYTLIRAITKQANFSSDLIQVILASSEKDLKLPLERTPARFAVLKKDGSVSNTWGVNIENSGDAYIYCRDNMKGQKISLHRSGKQHISFDESVTKLPHFSGSRFMNQWQEPEFEDNAVPTFCLLFPNWGIELTRKQVTDAESKWKKNELFIIGHEKEMTVVSFYVVDEGRKMVYRGDRSVISLCRVPLKPGKILHVFAERQREGDLRALIEEKAFPHAGAFLSNQKLQKGSYCLAVTGQRGEHRETHYMVTFSVDYTPPSLEK